MDCCIKSCFTQSFVPSGFTSVVLSTIERRYRFSSTAAGLIASTFDMAVLVSVLFISYLGGKGHKPRWLGISLIVQGAGEFLASYPASFGGRGKTVWYPLFVHAFNFPDNSGIPHNIDAHPCCMMSLGVCYNTCTLYVGPWLRLYRDNGCPCATACISALMVYLRSR